jgi:hypothetical protein
MLVSVERYVVRENRIIGAVARTREGREFFFRPNDHRGLTKPDPGEDFPKWTRWESHELPVEGNFVWIEVVIPTSIYWATFDEFLAAIKK